jgi:hypothetical protein
MLFPLPFIPTRKGRGNNTFYEFIVVKKEIHL